MSDLVKRIITLTPELDAALREHSARLAKPMTIVVRDAIESFLRAEIAAKAKAAAKVKPTDPVKLPAAERVKYFAEHGVATWAEMDSLYAAFGIKQADFPGKGYTLWDFERAFPLCKGFAAELDDMTGNRPDLVPMSPGDAQGLIGRMVRAKRGEEV